jgi:poly(3-hydroxybutyrate) depolymerase
MTPALTLALCALGLLLTPPHLSASVIQDFDSLYARLAAGRSYAADVPRGRIDGTRTISDGTPHPYVLLIPETYDTARSYPLRIWLHGGVGRPAYERPGAWWRNYDRTASEEHITLIPASWNASKW